MIFTFFSQHKLPFLTSILVCGLPFSYSWLNQYDKEFSIVCPTGQAVSRIQSHHDNHYEDRQWNIECRPIGNFSDMCFWTGKFSDTCNL